MQLQLWEHGQPGLCHTSLLNELCERDSVLTPHVDLVQSKEMQILERAREALTRRQAIEEGLSERGDATVAPWVLVQPQALGLRAREHHLGEIGRLERPPAELIVREGFDAPEHLRTHACMHLDESFNVGVIGELLGGDFGGEGLGQHWWPALHLEQRGHTNRLVAIVVAAFHRELIKRGELAVESHRDDLTGVDGAGAAPLALRVRDCEVPVHQSWMQHVPSARDHRRDRSLKERPPSRPVGQPSARCKLPSEAELDGELMTVQKIHLAQGARKDLVLFGRARLLVKAHVVNEHTEVDALEVVDATLGPAAQVVAGFAHAIDARRPS